ncbi:peptidoglycan D,D-transpeptidase FtsI family protein [Algihabitans albus]|uniref:peptidoglycan D,D-transpeptidase FtsI family protein n=1 Tax=Algihabitans albus TaxID=2164067 RepID=UPI001ABD032A|nr:penicillin-binding protein 2 [Algihabitans albus]
MRRHSETKITPTTPCGMDLGQGGVNGGWTISLDGQRKAALEMGRTRLLVAAAVFMLAFLAVGLRLADLALLSEQDEPKRAETPSAAAALETQRAEILDRNGQVLATTLPTNSLYANPRRVIDAEAAAIRLAQALPGFSVAELTAKLNQDTSFTWIKRGLTPRETARINGLGLPGLDFVREERRFYPHGHLTGHLIGYTNIDNVGQIGLEASFDDVLRGSNEPLRSSLDLRLQHILVDELRTAMEEWRGIGAAGMVMDVHSGEILAMASLPLIDPNAPQRIPDSAFLNRATQGVYELGSIFKVFSTAMALDLGVVGLTDGYDVTNPIRAGRFRINDFKPKRGVLSIPEILMYSSNIGTVQMTLTAGTEAQQRFFERLGLLDPVSLELGEVGRPLLPQVWREINTMTISYGHGIAVTPLQAARAMAAMVNGGQLVPATLLKRVRGERIMAEQVMSPETSNKMNWLLRLVVKHGTTGKADAEGYRVGGKTGTADKLAAGGGYAVDKRIASVLSAFPMDNPRYVVMAMVDEPKPTDYSFGYATGGWVAAPVVKSVVERMAPLLGIEPQAEPAEEPAVSDDWNPHLIPVNLRGRHVAAR